MSKLHSFGKYYFKAIEYGVVVGGFGGSIYGSYNFVENETKPINIFGGAILGAASGFFLGSVFTGTGIAFAPITIPIIGTKYLLEKVKER